MHRTLTITFSSLIALVLASLCGMPPALAGSRSGAFVIKGHLLKPRFGQTTVLLNSGALLVVGGSGRNIVHNDAELLDPNTGQSIDIGEMAPGPDYFKYLHSNIISGTLLANGKVLLVDSSFGPLAALYDPGSRKFSPTGSMVTRYCDHRATLLRNGQVLITGEFLKPDITPVSCAQLYDTQTGTFRAIASMVTPRSSHTATLLADGRVFITGGLPKPGAGSALAAAEVYEPSRGTFRSVGNMTVGRDGHTASLLLDNRVLITGGNGDNRAELFDPQTETFSPTGTMHVARFSHTATLLKSGKVLITGELGPGEDSRTSELYDPSTGLFQFGPNMAVGRYGHTATRLSNGDVVIVGGSNFSDNGLSIVERYIP
jgi:hypothetical protein